MSKTNNHLFLYTYGLGGLFYKPPFKPYIRFKFFEIR